MTQEEEEDEEEDEQEEDEQEEKVQALLRQYLVVRHGGVGERGGREEGASWCTGWDGVLACSLPRAGSPTSTEARMEEEEEKAVEEKEDGWEEGMCYMCETMLPTSTLETRSNCKSIFFTCTVRQMAAASASGLTRD